MILNSFSFGDIRQAALLAALFGSLSVASVSAVELVGKPVPLSSSSASMELEQPIAQQAPELEPAMAAQEAAAPVANDPFAKAFVGNAPFESGDDDRLVIVVAIIFCIGGPIIIILTLIAMHYRAKERREKNINANIERLLAAGRDIPIELLRGDEPYVGPESMRVRDDIQLQKGIKNVCLGVGLFVSLSIFFGIQFGAIGFIVVSVGASQLWLWKLSGSKQDKLQNQG